MTVNILKPGDFCFNTKPSHLTQLATVLGSSYAITVWHPHRKIGGMCHCIASESAESDNKTPQLSARYITDAALMLNQAAADAKTLSDEYIVNIFGGATIGDSGQVNPHLPFCNCSICNNKRKLVSALASLDFKVTHSDLGERYVRHLRMDLSNGAITVTKKHGSGRAPVSPLTSPLIPASTAN